jgi:hypothetical protein
VAATAAADGEKGLEKTLDRDGVGVGVASIKEWYYRQAGKARETAAPPAAWSRA